MVERDATDMLEEAEEIGDRLAELWGNVGKLGLVGLVRLGRAELDWTSPEGRRQSRYKGRPCDRSRDSRLAALVPSDDVEYAPPTPFLFTVFLFPSTLDSP